MDDAHADEARDANAATLDDSSTRTIETSSASSSSSSSQATVEDGGADEIDSMQAPPEPVTRLGRWRLLEQLGCGGMGSVWRAERADGEFAMTAAIKRLNGWTSSDTAIQRFRRERQILADIVHPNVCRLLDGGTETNGSPYLVMEHIAGRHLDEYFADASLSHEQLLELVIKVCEGLSAAHRRGIIHRDVKPSNILVQDDGEPKLVDFGIAYVTGPNEATYTSAGRSVMTPAYASPEQWKGEECTAASDVFALGIILADLLLGWRVPAPGRTPVQLPEHLRARVTPELWTTLETALRDDPSQRYPDADALGSALRNLLDRPTINVFLSSSGDDPEDVNFGLEVYAAILECGAYAFSPPKNIALAESWLPAVTRAVQSSELFVLSLRRDGSLSELAARELDIARESAARTGIPRIVSIRADQGDACDGRAPVLTQLEDVASSVWNTKTDLEQAVSELLGAATPSSVRPSTSGAALVPRPTYVATRSLESMVPAPGPKVTGRDSGNTRRQAPANLRVEHPEIESACRRELALDGALIRIKGPRRVGKTSLMAQLLQHARQAQFRTATINLQLADSRAREDLDRLLRWLCASVSKQLSLPARPDASNWDDIFGAKDNCTGFFEDHILREPSPLVLAIDNVDWIFECAATADEFLSVLRAWHELGKTQEPWGQLRLVLVHSTEIYLPLDINHSPFNVGHPVTLSDWDKTAVGDLAERNGVALRSAELSALHQVIGGHPHLVRLALHHLREGASIHELLSEAATDQGAFADHLRHLLWLLGSQPSLAKAAAQVVATDEPVRLDTATAFKLASLGVVHMAGNGVEISRELYRSYLRQHAKELHADDRVTQ